MNDVMLRIRIEQAKERVCKYCGRHDSMMCGDCCVLGPNSFDTLRCILNDELNKYSSDLYRKYNTLFTSFICVDFMGRDEVK